MFIFVNKFLQLITFGKKFAIFSLDKEVFLNILICRNGSSLICQIDGENQIELMAPGSNKNLDVFSILHVG